MFPISRTDRITVSEMKFITQDSWRVHKTKGHILKRTENNPYQTKF